MLKVKAFPQVQRLILSTSADRAIFGPDQAGMVICEPFPVMLVLYNFSSESLHFTLDSTLDEMAAILNGHEAVQRVGRVDIFEQEPVIQGNCHYRRVNLVYVINLGVEPSDVPRLEFESEGGELLIDCNYLQDNSDYTVTATLQMVQTPRQADGFSVGFADTISGPRFTSHLELNVTEEILQRELLDVFSWNCSFPIFPPRSNVILVHESYEDRRHGVDNTTAFCGIRSKRSPRRVWNSTDPQGDHVRIIANTVSL